MKGIKTLLSVALLLFMTFSLTACSSGPPDDIIESALAMHSEESFLGSKVWKLTDYDITDESSEDRDGRTYYYINADVEISYAGTKNTRLGMPGDSDIKKVRVKIWKEGNDWKVRKA